MTLRVRPGQHCGGDDDDDDGLLGDDSDRSGAGASFFFSPFFFFLFFFFFSRYFPPFIFSMHMEGRGEGRRAFPSTRNIWKWKNENLNSQWKWQKKKRRGNQHTISTRNTVQPRVMGTRQHSLLSWKKWMGGRRGRREVRRPTKPPGGIISEDNSICRKCFIFFLNRRIWDLFQQYGARDTKVVMEIIVIEVTLLIWS